MPHEYMIREPIIRDPMIREPAAHHPVPTDPCQLSRLPTPDQPNRRYCVRPHHASHATQPPPTQSM